MRKGTSRDGRQQSRLIRGDCKGFEICTVDHQKGGEVRVDTTIAYTDTNHEIGVYAHKDVRLDGDKYFKVYQPCAGDSLHPPDKNYIPYDEFGMLHVDEEVNENTVAWWMMACGRTMGLLKGMLVEYDTSTLAPLGLIVGADELIGKRITVLDSGVQDNCLIPEDDEEMSGFECGAVGGGPMREQAVIMYDPKTKVTTVVQPNEDGSYWRKIVRNKMVRMMEVRRLQAAALFARELQSDEDSDQDPVVVSSWGPYVSTVGTAKRTGVAGLTAPARLADEYTPSTPSSHAASGSGDAKDVSSEKSATTVPSDARKRLAAAKELYEDGLINEEDYTKMKAEVLTMI